jgi:hypothetical protein
MRWYCERLDDVFEATTTRVSRATEGAALWTVVGGERGGALLSSRRASADATGGSACAGLSVTSGSARGGATTAYREHDGVGE